MPPPRPALDSPPDDLLREVSERYGLRFPIMPTRLAGGYANDVFRLDSSGPPTVLHVKYPPVDGDSQEWEHQVLARLSAHLPEALAPLPAINGSTWFWFDGRPVWLVPWAPGAPARPEDRRAVRHGAGPLARVPRGDVRPAEP